VFCVESEVCGRLEGADEAARPTVATVEGASREVAAAVMKEIRGVRGPFVEVSGGDGAPVVRGGCGLELVEVGAGGFPCGGRSKRHDSPSRRRRC
jgi:hypothetical protein